MQPDMPTGDSPRRSLVALWREQGPFGRVIIVAGLAVAAVALTLCPCLIVTSAFLSTRASFYSPAPTAISAWTVTPRPTALRSPTHILTPARTATAPTRRPTEASTPTLGASAPARPTEMLTPSPGATARATATRLATLVPAAPVAVTAWVSNTTPRQNTAVTVYGKITSSGAGVADVPMHATWYYKGDTSVCDGRSDGTGIALCERNIGRAVKDYHVSVQVTFFYRGRIYTASTGFTPQ